MIPYILHAAILIAAGVVFYKLLLKKLTFYVLNRWVLICCLMAAFLLPLLPMPKGLTWRTYAVPAVEEQTIARQGSAAADKEISEKGQTKVEQDETIGKWEAPVGKEEIRVKLEKSARQEMRGDREKLAGQEEANTNRETSADPTLARELPLQRKKATSVEKSDSASNNSAISKLGVSGLLKAAMKQRSITRLLFWLYLCGVIILSLNLLSQVVLLLVQRYKGPVVRDGQYLIVTGAGMHGPCSFGNIIFIHPNEYDPETYQQILLHEKIHAGGRHTLDILLAELGIIFQWFNPFVWHFRREMETNLEFLTDRNVLRHPGVERMAYQLSLVRVATPGVSLDITSNYNQSLLKRRIVMMNTQDSSRRTAWKYFFLLPFFMVLAGVLNRPAALAQNVKEKTPSHIKQDTVTIPVVVTDAQNVVRTTVVSSVPPIEAPVPVPIVVTDAQGVVHSTVVPPVTPSVEVNVQPVPQANVHAIVEPSITSVLPVLPSISIVSDTTKPGGADRTEGAWFIVSNQDKNRKDESVNIELRGENDDRNWSSSFSVPRVQLSTLNSVGKVEFSLSREAGTIFFTGQFDGSQGFGHYKFVPDAGYLEHMREKKIVEREDELMSFYMLDIKKNYVDMLQANGYPEISKHHLISMAALHIDEDFIKSIRGAGYRDISENQLITFKALKIDGAYLRKFPASTPVNDIVTYRSLRIDSEYVASLKKAGYPDLSSRDIITLKSMKIDADYIKGFNDIGYKDIPIRTVTTFKSMNVTPEYVKGFLKAGYQDIPGNTIVSFKSMGITPEYVASFQNVGLKDISRQNIISMKSMNITPDYVKGFMDLGYKDISPQHLVSLKSMNITADFVKAFNSIGFKDIPLNQLHTLKAMGVTPDYVTKMKEKGFVSDDLNKYIRLKNAFE
jgi:hypothetical protein